MKGISANASDVRREDTYQYRNGMFALSLLFRCFSVMNRTDCVTESLDNANLLQ